MALQLPEFLTKSYLEKVLQKHEDDSSLRVDSFECKPAVAAGNNYASLLLRTSVKYVQNEKNFEKSFIIKTVPADAEMAQTILEEGLFTKEIAMYGRVLPKYHKLLEKIGDDDKLFSPAVFVDAEYSTLIFNDLKTDGFEQADRLTGVDEAHVELVIRKIAKFHACSMVLMDNGLEDFPEFQEAVYNADSGFNALYQGMFDACLSQIKITKDLVQYLPKLEKIRDVMMDQAFETFKRSRFPLNVMTHGDLWVTNIMFKYDEDRKPTDLVMIDFTDGNVGPAVIDLMYFILTSTKTDIKLNRFSENLVEYHKNLVQCLKMLEYKGKMPTLFELYSQRVEKSFYELITVAIISPIMLNEQQVDADLGGLMSDTPEAKQFRQQMYKNEKLMETLKHFLPIWDQMGLLDPLY